MRTYMGDAQCICPYSRKALAGWEKMCRNFSPQPSAGPPAEHWDDYSARLLCQITVTPRTPPDGHTQTQTHTLHTHTHKHLASHFRTLSCNHSRVCWLHTRCIQYILTNTQSSAVATRHVREQRATCRQQEAAQREPMPAGGAQGGRRDGRGKDARICGRRREGDCYVAIRSLKDNSSSLSLFPSVTGSRSPK